MHLDMCVCVCVLEGFVVLNTVLREGLTNKVLKFDGEGATPGKGNIIVEALAGRVLDMRGSKEMMCWE